ncbi:MAG: hypothetical protein LBH18_04320 [Spirochaetaceae bacterium]|jgi:hypothetical protein|nr:hypothetical protein [Spirochaetaceae bacterium]
MAMQPVDLQIIFSQLDTIAKDVSAQKDGHALRGAINADTLGKKLEEKSHSVNEMHDGGEEMESLSAYDNHDSQKRNSDKKGKNGSKDDKRRDFNDPSLGNYVDLTG